MEEKKEEEEEETKKRFTTQIVASYFILQWFNFLQFYQVRILKTSEKSVKSKKF